MGLVTAQRGLSAGGGYAKSVCTVGAWSAGQVRTESERERRTGPGRGREAGRGQRQSGDFAKE